MHFGDSQSARIVAFSSQARQQPKARTLPGACHYADVDEVAAFFKLRSVMQCSANWGEAKKALDLDLREEVFKFETWVDFQGE